MAGYRYVKHKTMTFSLVRHSIYGNF